MKNQQPALASDEDNYKINIAFIGTSSFGLPALRWLSKELKGLIVITQPDRPTGRKQTLEASPIKKYALSQGLDFFQPEDINSQETVAKIKQLKLDLIIVVAYGQIFKKAVLDIPRFGCLNLHGSLLPKYRGASPVQAAILNEDKTSGVTIIKMDAGLDTGKIVAQTKIKIQSDEMAAGLHDRLADLVGKLLIKILPSYLAGEIKLLAQDNSLATYTKKITRVDGQIFPSRMTAGEILRRWRAYHPWPGIWLEDKKFGRVKLLEIKKCPEVSGSAVGSLSDLLVRDGSGLYLSCSDACWEVNKHQVAGRSPVSASIFLINS